VPRRGLRPWSATLVTWRRIPSKKLRRDQEILAATPAIDVLF
jgi:hypothetical protein